jgi:hypothetical protein
MIVDAAETVLGYFGFDRTIYGTKKNKVTRKWRWLEELRQERERYRGRDDGNNKDNGKDNRDQGYVCFTYS